MNKKITNCSIKKAYFWAKILVKFPGVLAIFLSGSFAQKTATKASDIDFFIITKSGRIFTTRFFVAGILKLFGVLADNSKNHAGKICPNHYISINNLEISEKDAYAAKLFSHNKFLAGDINIWYSFVENNKTWINEFGEKFHNNLPLEDKPPHLGSHQNGETNLLFQKIENWCKQFQKNKIAKKKLPKNAKVWLTDKEIRLHAVPKNLQ